MIGAKEYDRSHIFHASLDGFLLDKTSERPVQIRKRAFAYHDEQRRVMNTL
jgi:hypothetical protein